MIVLFQNEQQHGEDADLKAYAAQTLPKLQAHLQMAEQLQQSGGAAVSSHSGMGGGSAGSAGMSSGAASSSSGGMSGGMGAAQ